MITRTQRIAQAIIKYFTFPPISKKPREAWAYKLAAKIDDVIEPEWIDLEPYEKIRIIEAMGFEYRPIYHAYSAPSDVRQWHRRLVTAAAERAKRKATA